MTGILDLLGPLVLISFVAAVLWVLLRGAREDPDHGDAEHAGANTLAYYARLESRQGWDREAAGCGPWDGSQVTDAARTLRWRERA